MIQPGHVAKNEIFGPSDWESNPQPRESSAMLCKLSYGGRSREHGHKFNIYYGGNAGEMKGIINGILWHLHSTTNSKVNISDEGNLS